MTKDNDQPVMVPVGPSIAVPAKFQLKDNTATARKTFKQRFTLYLLAGGYNKRPENEKVALLLTVGRDEMIEIYNAFEMASAADKEKYDPVIAKFEEHFIPKQHFSELPARYKFNGTVQGESESLDSFIIRLRNIAKDCEYGDQKEKLIRDGIIFGVREDRHREKLFKDEDLDLAAAVKICQAHDATRKGMQAMKEDNHRNTVMHRGHRRKKRGK